MARAGEDTANRTWVRAFTDALSPWSRPAGFPNFIADAGDAEAVRAAYGAERHARLVEAKDRWDPEQRVPAQPQHRAVCLEVVSRHRHARDERPPVSRQPLGDGRAEHERLVEHAAHAALDLQLGLEVGHPPRMVDHGPAQDLCDEQPHEPAVELAAGDAAQLVLGLGRRDIGILYESGAVRTS